MPSAQVAILAEHSRITTGPSPNSASVCGKNSLWEDSQAERIGLHRVSVMRRERQLPKKESAEALLRLRRLLKMSQAVLAGKIGVSESTIYQIEHVELRLSQKFANNACRATGVSPDHLLAGELRYVLTNKLYTVETYLHWKTVTGVDDKQTDDFVDWLSHCLRTVMKKAGGTNRSPLRTTRKVI